MDLELRHLRAFVAVVDAGTFTGAAGALGVSQAAVSRAVVALEAALGARLLHRSTRHVRLTGTGTHVLVRARTVLDEVADLRRFVEQSRTEVRVGYAWAALGKHTRRLGIAGSATPRRSRSGSPGGARTRRSTSTTSSRSPAPVTVPLPPLPGGIPYRGSATEMLTILSANA
ncbi:LysR family transcriptional regulator [Rhizomonospora bruguierae]|uniref:LysR family transcriptional regulator n=1 Tax=Rhizomonospora bruguierae TaxID=1581705 RepID=UPI001BCB4739|nr:LysR family transcriptional regulator [Micromonospora sp. NBRC 107566]